MKYSLIILLFIAASICSAQDIAKDTIVLERVRIDKQKQKKIKVKKVKYRDDPWCLQEFDNMLEMVTLVDKLPPGRIHSLTFFVNEILEAGYTSDDAKFEVMLYEVNTDGTPGKKLNAEPETFTVGVDQKGEYTINLYGLDIKSTGRFFAGLKRIGYSSANNFGVNICTICHPGDFTSYYKMEGKDWQKSVSAFGAFKMDVRVAPEKTKSLKQ